MPATGLVVGASAFAFFLVLRDSYLRTRPDPAPFDTEGINVFSRSGTPSGSSAGGIPLGLSRQAIGPVIDTDAARFALSMLVSLFAVVLVNIGPRIWVGTSATPLNTLRFWLTVAFGVGLFVMAAHTLAPDFSPLGGPVSAVSAQSAHAYWYMIGAMMVTSFAALALRARARSRDRLSCVLRTRYQGHEGATESEGMKALLITPLALALFAVLLDPVLAASRVGTAIASIALTAMLVMTQVHAFWAMLAGAASFATLYYKA